MSTGLKTVEKTVVPKSQDRAAIVDEFGEVAERMAAWQPALNPHAQRYTELKLQILSWYENADAEQKFIAEGTRYKVPVKARKRKRTVINVAKLVKLWGLAKVAKFWTPTLDLIEKEVEEDKQGQFIHEERTGPRELGAPVRILEEKA